MTQSIIIGSSAILTIEPGVAVCLDPGLGIDVGSPVFGGGTLSARGTASQPIVFTASQTNPTVMPWASIRFTTQATNGTASSGCALDRCVVEFGGASGPTVNADTIIPWIRDSVFRDNAETAIFISATVNSPKVTIQGCTFLRNSSTGSSGGLEIAGGSTHEIWDNVMDQTASSRKATIHSTGASMSVSALRNTISNSSGRFTEGAMLVSTSAGSAVIRSNNMFDNRGFGIVVASVLSTIESNVVQNNTTGISVARNCRIADNKVMGNSLGISIGNAGLGAIVRNTVVGNGPNGGIRASSSSAVTVADNLIANNVSNLLGGGFLGTAVNPTITGNVFANNSALSGGGCVVSGANTGTISANVFHGNTAVDGGALFIQSVAAITIDGNNFIGNEAAPMGIGRGGALFADSANINLSTTGSTLNQFAGNQANEGDAIYFASLSPAILSANGVLFDSWPAGTTQPANLIYDFFDDAALGIVVAGMPAPRQPRFYDLGAGLGVPPPTLDVTGSLNPGFSLNLIVSNGPANAFAALLGSPDPSYSYFDCGLVIPMTGVVIPLPPTNPMGTTSLRIQVPSTLPTGIKMLFQGVILDATSPNGLFTLTNGIAAFN